MIAVLCRSASVASNRDLMLPDFSWRYPMIKRQIVENYSVKFSYSVCAEIQRSLFANLPKNFIASRDYVVDFLSEIFPRRRQLQFSLEMI